MIDVALSVVACVVAFPIAVFCVEIFAASFYRTKQTDGLVDRPALSVIIPAHNEEQSIAETLGSVCDQLTESDALLVVADNCDDRTAAIVREFSESCERVTVDVIERHDEANRGKGFAIDAGLRYLDANHIHGQFVVLIDADCTLDPLAIDYLTRAAVESGRAVQGKYLMHRPKNDSVGDSQTESPGAVVSELAFTLKNYARALGDEMLSWPCVLRGSGMIFPWEMLRDTSVASDHIVEDVKLGLDLTYAGNGPRFCAEAGIRSTLPTSQDASTTQRTRWEHGYLAMLSHVPNLLLQGIAKFSWGMIGTAAVLSIPPLSLQCMVWFVTTIVAIACWVGGIASITAASILLTVGTLLFLAVIVGWYRFARHEIPWASLASIPGYIVGKLPIYLRFVKGRERNWVRTSRTP